MERTRCWPHSELSRKEEAGDVLSLFSTNKNTKFVETTIYTELFTSHGQKPDKHLTDQGGLSKHQPTYTELFTRHKLKAREKHDRSIEFVKTMIYLTWVVYETKKYRQRRHQQKIKNLHSKRSLVFYYRSWSTKVNYIKHCHQEKKYQC